MTARRYVSDPTKRPLVRGLLLFLLPLPLLIALLAALATGQLGAVLANGAGFGLFMLGAALARSGFRVERAYQRRSLARAPRLPLKALGGLVVALAAAGHVLVEGLPGVGKTLLVRRDRKSVV